MSEFKAGDKIKMLGNCESAEDGKIYIVIADLRNTNNLMGVGVNPNKLCHCQEKWELLETNKNNMSLKEKFITAFLSEPEKSFRKMGITNGDGILTTEGQEIFLTWLLKKQGAEFKTEVVDELSKEEEK